MKQISIALFILVIGNISMLYAHDFVATDKNGQKIFFNVTDAQKRYAEITYQGSITSDQLSPYKGDITIPSKVKHKNTEYRIVGIHPKAFSNANALKSIVLPSGLLYIGDFAFEGCGQLEKIVFPGNSVRLGKGTFFRCTSIRQISLGSDWTQINLKMFCWSQQLTSISIPAKLTRIQNMKSLKELQSIEVDSNNPNFTSINGILYNKNKETLLGCPRKYTGKVRILEGTTTVNWGAFIDCTEITEIDFPASLKILSFREFSRMKRLTQIIMRSESPVMTASTGGKHVFLLTIADNQKVKLITPKSAQNKYKEALYSDEGEYTEISTHLPNGVSPEQAIIPLVVKSANILEKGNLIGVKNFSKYE